MTVGVAVKVFDGIVLAADSATTLELKDTNGAVVDHQVYNNAHKVFHLHRDLPVAGLTFGLGQIGPASISTLAKDLRQRLMGKDPLREEWKLNPSAYTMHEVADRVVEHLYTELYAPLNAQGVLGFVIAGYSSGSDQAEVWQIEIGGTTATPLPVQIGPPDAFGWWAFAQPLPVSRLFNGIDEELLRQIAGMPGIDATDLQAKVRAIQENPAIPPMPLADAIALAHFMVDTTVGFRRFIPGTDTVGGPVDVASISRHEGFRWINRKYYYPSHLNPKDPHP